MTTSAVGNLGRPTNPPSLWRDRAFNVFWSGQVVSMLGDTFSFLAFPLLMLRATGSVRDMGLVAAAGGAGQVLSLACAGAIVDRVSPIPLMVGCDVARAALLAAIPLCWHTLGPCVPLVYVVAVVTGLLGDVFAVAYQAAVTTMVRPAQLIDVNSRLQASMAVTMAVGPALAGVTCEVFGPAQAVGLDALSFLLSAASLWTLRPAFAGLRSGPSRAPTSMRDGLRYIWNHPVLRSLMIVLSLATAVTAGVVPLFVFRLEHDLASTDAMVGIIIGAAGVGGVLGAVAAAKLRDRVGFAACFVSATLIEGICISGGARVAVTGLMVVLALGYSLGERLRATVAVSLRQETVPREMIGRITAIYWIGTSLFVPVGAALSTALAGRIGAPLVLAALGGLTIVIGLATLATPARTGTIPS